MKVAVEVEDVVVEPVVRLSLHGPTNIGENPKKYSQIRDARVLQNW